MGGLSQDLQFVGPPPEELSHSLDSRPTFGIVILMGLIETSSDLHGEIIGKAPEASCEFHQK